MAQKRMFSKQIIHSDAFMDMPSGTQLLYFYLAMDGDDDGFVSNPKKIMRMIGSNDDDYKLLIAKRFILVFPDGICVIKHWKIHNYIQADRYHETKYVEHKEQLHLKDNNSYTEKKEGLKEIAGKKKLTDEEVVKEKYPWLDLDALNEWVKYRKDKRKPVTNKGLELQMKFLEQHKEDHKAIIEQSIMNGWTGLFELKDNGRSKKTTRDI